MAAFAKLFGEGDDQILFVRRRGDTGPEMRIFFDPKVESLDLCEFAPGWNDDEDGEKKADEAFAKVTEATAKKDLKRLRKSVGKMLPA